MPIMRPKKTAYDLPPRMLRRTKTLKSGKVWVGYYYNGRDEAGRRKEIPLGGDLAEAKKKWAELEGKPVSRVVTMGAVFDRYEREIVPGKSANTQRAYSCALSFLRKVFRSAPVSQIRPQHIAQYRDARQKKANSIRIELAVFSSAFDCAREWGYTDRENPCRGVKKPAYKPRDFYAEKAVWDAIYSHAAPELRDAMDLAYLTGQRPGDVLKMQHSDIQDGELVLQQQKTGKKLRIMLAGTELEKVIARIRKKKVGSFYLVSTERGRSLSIDMLQIRWRDAREKAAAAHPEIAESIQKFQFRDIRAKAASDIQDLKDASALLGHTEQQLTENVYRRLGKIAKPTR